MSELERKPRIRVTPNLLGIAFGLAGLAACWQTGTAFLGPPIWIAHSLFALAAAAWLLVSLAWAIDAARRKRSLSAELRDAVFGPFASLVPIVGMLLSLWIFSLDHEAGRILVYIFAACTIVLGACLTGQWIADRVEIDSIHPGYFLPTVAGGFIAAQAVGTTGSHDIGVLLFGIGMFCWVLLGSVILVRLFTRPALPPPLLPTLAIEVAPPAVAANAWYVLDGRSFDLLYLILSGYAVLMFLVQLRLLPLYLKAPFGPGYWAFTFAFASVAMLGMHWTSRVEGTTGRILMWLVLCLISILIGAIAVATIRALVLKKFLPKAI